MGNKIKTAGKAVKEINDGATVMIGGFSGVGTPEVLVDALCDKGVKNLTVISCDAGRPGRGVGKLLRNGQVKKLIATHVGINPEVAGRCADVPEIFNVEYELIPQGTFVERIRAAGCGLGGILTPVGLGTIVEQGKEKITVNGKEYLLETPLFADFALIRGSLADRKGNVIYQGATRNFNTVMAMAAGQVIVGTTEIMTEGYINPNMVMTPGILVDTIVGGEQTCLM